MQAAQLLQHLQQPKALTADDVIALKDLTAQYPYFQAAHALLAKAAYDKNQPDADHRVQAAAISATDRNHLRALLEDAPPFAPAPPEAPSVPEEPPQAAPITTAPHQFINGYINHIRQRAAQRITKKKSLEQLDIIQAFIQKNVSFKPQAAQNLPDPTTQADLTKESTVLHDDLLTENLAQILFQQGKVQRAIHIYHKLGLKFPKKRTYFDALAEELKTQL